MLLKPFRTLDYIIIECEIGFYGDHCQQMCNKNCNNHCQISNGICTDGCKDPGMVYTSWYTGDRCDVEIRKTGC